MISLLIYPLLRLKFENKSQTILLDQVSVKIIVKFFGNQREPQVFALLFVGRRSLA